jgi:hypothetical protein
MTEEVRRKFTNPTTVYVGAVIYDEDGKRKGVPVAPGEAIWLSEREERATAEAPMNPADNPFVAEWEEPITRTEGGEVLESVKRQGMLVLSDEPARPIASEPVEEIVGSPGVPPTPTEPPVEGQPSENEIVATPEAVPANDEALAARRAAEDGPTPVTERPAGTEAISTPPSHHPLPV